MVSGKNGFELYHGWDREAAIREIRSCTDIDLVSSSSLGTVICNTRIKNNADKIFSESCFIKEYIKYRRVLFLFCYYLILYLLPEKNKNMKKICDDRL